MNIHSRDYVRTRHQFLRQGVTLVGLGLPTFERALDAVGEVYGFFDRAFEDGTLEPEGTITLSNPNNSLNVSNRYLTPKKDAPNIEGIPLEEDVDPRGYLATTIRGGPFIYTEDNQVKYFICESDSSGEKR